MYHVILTEPVMVSDVTGVGNNCLIRNENTNLTCTVTGVPTPTIEWFKSSNDDDRVTIRSDDKFTVMGNILIINTVTDDDANRYGCTATNIVNGTERIDTAADIFSVCGECMCNVNTLKHLVTY